MKLSIITINYNNRKGLLRTIESVERQTWRDFEWIVIDGGSTDGSRELIEEHADSFAYWVSEPDNGVYNAMNKGIRQAKGEWLQFLNSGDWICEDTTLERVFSREYTADIVYGDTILAMPEGQLIPKKEPDILSLSYLVSTNLCHQSTFVRANCFEVSGYNEQYHIVSDWEKWVLWVLDGKRFEHISNNISCYDMTGISSQSALLMDEFKQAKAATIPYHILVDIERILAIEERWGFLSHRRTFAHWPDRFHRFCKWVDGILSKIEKHRKK